jgi:hypothetical protein
MFQAFHQRIELLGGAVLCWKLSEPLPKKAAQCLMTGFGKQARSLDQPFIGMEGYPLHRKIVYTVFVLELVVSASHAPTLDANRPAT